MKVLIIEGDRKTASFVEKGMKEAGMVVDVCHDVHEGLDQALVHDYDVAVIDVMLPGLDGLSVVEAMRAEEVSTPVLILSAKRSVSDRIEG
ncbi:response regulator [Akkermansiaceae bacterium]|nr:response regulator [Akkermansiaceae bacterium]MDB4510024.1 response regulator [Akkermansiaceae bacterium]